MARICPKCLAALNQNTPGAAPRHKSSTGLDAPTNSVAAEPRKPQTEGKLVGTPEEAGALLGRDLDAALCMLRQQHIVGMTPEGTEGLLIANSDALLMLTDERLNPWATAAIGSLLLRGQCAQPINDAERHLVSIIVSRIGDTLAEYYEGSASLGNGSTVH
jgi:hypothetical protein